MLQQSPIFAYIPASNLERARAFYEQTLGFTADHVQPGGVSYACANGTAFFLYPSPGAGTSQASQAFWTVKDVRAEVDALRAKGVTFEEYDNPHFRTVNGIATGGGAMTAWFKDTEGNILAIVQPMPR